MTKLPIFASLPSGNPAQQFMHRARMFRKAACRLVDSSDGEQFLPKYLLLTHAIELALKAFVLHYDAAGKSFKRDHNLRNLYLSAIKLGFPENPTITENMNYLNNYHCSNYLRYPDVHEPATPMPDLSIIADETADYLLEQSMAIITRR